MNSVLLLFISMGMRIFLSDAKGLHIVRTYVGRKNILVGGGAEADLDCQLHICNMSYFDSVILGIKNSHIRRELFNQN